MTFLHFQQQVQLAPECRSSTAIAAASPICIVQPSQSSIFRQRTNRTLKFFLGLVVVFLADANAAGMDESRGQMLYQNHCIACHTTQVHWRDQRLAADWSSLRVQVRRWERNTGLSWSDDDVEAVSEYLNRLYYQFPEKPRDRIISLSGSNDRTIRRPDYALARLVFVERKEK